MLGYVKEKSVYQDLENKFTYHNPIGNQNERYELIRNLAKDYANKLQDLCPTSQELSLALTNLEQTVFWANASIARNEKEPTEAE